MCCCSPQCVCTGSLLRKSPFPALGWECNAVSPLLRWKLQMWRIFHRLIHIQTRSSERRNAAHTPPETSSSNAGWSFELDLGLLQCELSIDLTPAPADRLKDRLRSNTIAREHTFSRLIGLHYFLRAPFLLFQTELHKMKLLLGVISERESIQSRVCFEQARVCWIHRANRVNLWESTPICSDANNKRRWNRKWGDFTPLTDFYFKIMCSTK